MMTSERLRWLDSFRGVGILIVLLGHSQTPSQTAKFIYGFHMPLFFMLAGYLFKQDRTFPAFIRKTSEKCIISYFVLCGINLISQITTHFLAGIEYDIPNFVRGIIYSRGTLKCMPNCSPLWFLTALFSALVIYFAITRIRNRVLAFSAVLLCFAASVILDKCGCPKLFWNVDTAMMCIVFIFAGHMMRTENIIGKFEALRPAKQILLLIIMLCAGTAAIMLNDKKVDFDGNRYGNAVLMLIGAVSISSALFFAAKKIFDGKIFARRFSFLAYAGQHTLFIMGFDYCIHGITKPVLKYLGLYDWPIIFAVKLAVILIFLSLWNMLIKRIPDEKCRKLLAF